MPEAQHGLKTALRIVWILVRGALFGSVASATGFFKVGVDKGGLGWYNII